MSFRSMAAPLGTMNARYRDVLLIVTSCGSRFFPKMTFQSFGGWCCVERAQQILNDGLCQRVNRRVLSVSVYTICL